MFWNVLRNLRVAEIHIEYKRKDNTSDTICCAISILQENVRRCVLENCRKIKVYEAGFNEKN